MIESINNISNTTEGNSCRIMIVDHDPTNILVTELIIRKVIKNPQIKSFTIPHLALNYIEEEYGKAERKMPTLLLLDLYLPGTESYEFLDNFSSLRTNIREQFKIVALTSSIDRKEKQKAMSYPYVIDYQIKPLTREVLQQLIGKYNSSL